MNVKPNRPIISDNSNCVFFVRLVSILMKFVLSMSVVSMASKGALKELFLLQQLIVKKRAKNVH